MPALSFLLPSGLPSAAKSSLLGNCGLSSGPTADGFPDITYRSIEDTSLILKSDVPESCHMQAPWFIQEHGRILLKSATLLPRSRSYSLLVELARGKLHQIGSIICDMAYRGLKIGTEAPNLISLATDAFGEALCADNPTAASVHAVESIRLSCNAGLAYLNDYCAHLVPMKRHGGRKIDTNLAFTLRGNLPNPFQTAALQQAFNGVGIAIPWKTLEPVRGTMDWTALDSAVAWARSHGFRIHLGPLIVPENHLVPDWVLALRLDVGQIAAHLARFVDSLIRRYKPLECIDRFSVISSGNVAILGDYSEDEWLRLSWQALDAARQVDSSLEVSMGIRQPWGEIMAGEARDHNPSNYLDTLVRSVSNISSIDMEVLTGDIVGATHYRDMVDYHRLPEQFFGIIQKPMRMNIAMPAIATGESAIGSPSEGFTPQSQSHFMSQMINIYAASPYVTEIRWHQTFDNDPGGVPGAGLFDSSGEPRPILERCAELRNQLLT